MLRIPLTAIYAVTGTTFTSSEATFVIPFNDISGLVAKCTAASFSGNIGSPTGTQNLAVFIQTTDDGGATWYDSGRFTNIAGTVSSANAKWLSIPCAIGDGLAMANATDASLAASSVGLPILSSLAKIKYVFSNTGLTSVANFTVTVYSNSSER